MRPAMNLLKSFYISAYFTISFGLSGWAGYELMTGAPWLGWVGVLLTALPAALMLGVALIFRPFARTSGALPSIVITAVIGVAVAIAAGVRGEGWLPTAAAATGLIAFLVYDLWYSKLTRPPSELVVGKALPEFSLLTAAGEAFAHAQLSDGPALLMFYRGNWCPLCMAQIKEIAGMYRKFAETGVRVCLISPQPPGHTASLAKSFDVPFEFLVDPENRAARALGIAQSDGLPMGMQVLGYDSETVLPTVIITDASGTVVWTHETDNYRVRPEPETFLAVFREHGIA